MSLLQRLITAAYQGGKGALKAGKGSVDDILRSTPLGGAPVRRSVGTIDSVRPMTGRFSGTRIPGTSPAAMNNNAGILQSAPQVSPPLRGTIFGKSNPISPPKPGPTIPSGGQRVAPTTAFGGQNPIVGNVRTTPNVAPVSGGGLRGLMPKGPLDFLGRAGQVVSGAEIARKVGQGDIKGAAIQTAMTFPGKAFNAARGLFPAGGLGVAGLTGVGLAALELGAPASVADGTLEPGSAGYESLTPLERRQLYGGSGDMDAGPNVVSRKKEKPTVSETIIDDSNGRIVTQDQVRPEVVDTTTKLPPSAEQTMIDPYSYNLAVYGQGRKAAQSQTEMNKVRDLGLAINRSLYPQFNNTKTPNPMLQRMFPETYPGTLNGLIEEKGVQKPGSMSQVDADNAIIDSSFMDDKYRIAAATGEVEGLLSAEAQESLRQQFLQGQLKRYSLEY